MNTKAGSVGIGCWLKVASRLMCFDHSVLTGTGFLELKINGIKSIFSID